MYISEIMTTVPEDARGPLETKVYEELTRLGIKFERVDNDVVETMEECAEIDAKLGTPICKTLLVCNRQKTDYYLVLVPGTKRFDSKLFSQMMQCSRVSFASGDDMEALLGVVPGSASVMGVLNDAEGKVKVVIDKALADEQYFACNVGVNTTHIRFRTNNLINSLLPACKHKPEIIML